MFPDSKTEYYRILSVLELEWDERRERAERRDFHALSFRIKGNAVFEHGKKKDTVGTGDIAFVPKGFDYTLDAKSCEHLYVVHFEMLPEKAEEFSFIRPALFCLRKMRKTWQSSSLLTQTLSFALGL